MLLDQRQSWGDLVDVDLGRWVTRSGSQGVMHLGAYIGVEDREKQVCSYADLPGVSSVIRGHPFHSFSGNVGGCMQPLAQYRGLVYPLPFQTTIGTLRTALVEPYNLSRNP
jgi:hypothetical protein